MKHLVSILTIVLLLSGCADITSRGEQLGRQLIKAWGDTAALKAVDSCYQAALDSMNIPGTAGQLESAFLRTVGESDSLGAVAQAIALAADEFADKHAQPLVDALLDGSLDARQATDRLFLLHWAADLLGKEKHIAMLDETIDIVAGRLSEKKQMLLFSRAASPTALGKQMRAEREQPDTDTTAIDRRVAMLREIYDEAQLKEFLSAYNN